jgi:hypothetical protein
MDEAAPRLRDPHPASKPTCSGGHSWLLWGSLILLVVYPLSVGPAQKLYHTPLVRNDKSFRTVYGIVYAPIIVLHNKYRPIRKFYYWYLTEVWKVR